MNDLATKMNSIREALDAPVSYDQETGEATQANIDLVQDKLIKLSSLLGLSAECMAQARKELRNKELEVLAEIQSQISKTPASIVGKLLSAKTGQEESVLLYADRLNSALVHSIDGLRTIISKYKSELEQSKFQT